MPTPIRRILAATDLSHHAEVALRRAAGIAREHGAELEILHALAATPVLVPAWGDPGAAPWLREEVLSEGVQEHLSGLATRLVGDGGLVVRTRLLHGHPQDAIAQQAEDSDADLVVIGAHGEGGLLDRVLGSTARRLLRRCRRPVLVVRGESDAGPARVMVGTDFSDNAAQAVRALARLAPGADLLLVHAHEPELEKRMAYARVDRALGQRYLEAARQQAAQALDRAAADLAAEGIAVRTLLREGHPSRVLGQLIGEQGIELVAVGAHGKSMLEAGLLGSTSEHLLANAGCDVLVVPQV